MAPERVYRPRVLDQVLAGRLRSSGAVLLEGPKACGKSFTAEQVARSAVHLDLDRAAREALRVDPALVLDGDPPQLVDEWQLEATTVWNYVRDQVNRRAQPGQFILAGSAVPDDDAARHTGAGRMARLRMRPMTLFESGDGTGAVSLSALLAGDPPTARASVLTVPDLADLLVRGGWPLNLGLATDDAARANRDYLRNIAEVDISRIDPSRNDPARAERVLRSLARNVAMEHKVSRLALPADDDDSPMARTTAYDYLAALERLMVIELLQPWTPHLRSRVRLRTAPRTHFADPSLAAAALNASASALLRDLNTFGLLFESMVLRDVRVFADALDGRVEHYRDSDGLEVDLIVSTATTWGAFEVKLGSADVDRAAANLLALAGKVDTRQVGEPSVLAVITGTGYAYTRDDGVAVIPIGHLGP